MGDLLLLVGNCYAGKTEVSEDLFDVVADGALQAGENYGLAEFVLTSGVELVFFFEVGDVRFDGGFGEVVGLEFYFLEQ